MDKKRKPAAKIASNRSSKVVKQSFVKVIIRALINNPKIILADEPSGNLDTDNSEALYRIFRDINEEFGTIFIIVTHDRRITEQTDRIVEIRDGRIVMDLKR